MCSTLIVTCHGLDQKLNLPQLSVEKDLLLSLPQSLPANGLKILKFPTSE